MNESLVNEEAVPEDLQDFVDKNYHKVKNCEYYRLSLKECNSFKAKFHQYFVFGEFLDCSQWEEDLKNCQKYASEKNLEALASIIRHENERKMRRTQAHLNNDVWKKRESPPANWNSALPDWLRDSHKNSHLKE